MDQNGDNYGHREQVDVAGGPRTNMPCRLAPHGRHPSPCHVIDSWELLQKYSQASIQCRLDQWWDWKALDPWAHCHTIGASNRLTNWFLARISACAILVTTIEEHPRCYDQEAMDPRADQCLPTTTRCPRCSTDLLVSYKYSPTLHCKYGVWSSVEKCPHSFSKLSKLLQALL
jgi:hypothetical protein